MTTSNIKSYDDLVREREELEVLLRLHRDQIRHDLHGLREEFRPARQAVSTIGKFFTKDKSSPLLTTGANMLIDVVVKRILLGRAGWITKLIVPMLIKNYSSHVLSDNKGSIFKRIKSLFSKNGTSHSKKPDVDLRSNDN